MISSRTCPELDTAIEVGGFAGVSLHGLTNPYDALSFRLDVLTDVGGAHESTVITPTFDFGTPLSRTTYVGASLSADCRRRRLCRLLFRHRPVGLAGQRPAGVSIADGGMKSWRLGLLRRPVAVRRSDQAASHCSATGSYSHLSATSRIRRSSTIAAAPANGSARSESATPSDARASAATIASAACSAVIAVVSMRISGASGAS